MDIVTPPQFEPFTVGQHARGFLADDTLAVWSFDDEGARHHSDGILALELQGAIEALECFRIEADGCLEVYGASDETTERIRSALQEAFPGQAFPDCGRDPRWDFD
jgi:hypothetical protein